MEYHSGGSLPLLGRPRYCPGAKASGGYLCETGHCCGEAGCCTYYYELWWFWLLWTLLILFSCCCAYRHRRAKLMQRQQQQQRDSGLLAYGGASSYPSSMLDLSFLASLKLPSYEEVAAQPSTPPPPYSAVFTTPRYPQPPRTSEPHLLTQHHGALLHRRLSDGPSSFSSDSSSCSCDSCCPSSLCSSSMSAPITYETDTSHASTPGEATPPRLDVREQSAAAKERRSLPDSGTGPGAVRDQEALGPSGPLLTEPPLQYCPPSAPASPCPTTPPAEAPATAEAPPLAEGPPDSPAGSVSSGPSSPDSDSPTSPPYLGSSRTFCRRSVGPGPDPLAAGSPGHPPPDPGPCLDSAALDPGPASILGSSGFPAMRNLPQAPGETWSNTFPAALVQDPGPAGPHASGTPSPQRRDSLAAGPGPASTCPSSSWSQSPDLAPASPSPGARPCPAPAPDRAAAEAGLLVPGPDPPSPARGSRPAITVETESCGPFSPGSPPALTSSSVPATILLLDPLSAPPQAGRGGQASSLSPSPRPTQSPPKQTLFSPCVDVFEAEPLSWEDGEEEEEENEDDEEDVAADESQYRHRRLTGDSGIEVCRCRVDEDGEAEGPERKECTRRGGHGERDRKGRASSRLHDSVDCPARGQRQGGDTPTRTPPSEGADKAVVVVETV